MKALLALVVGLSSFSAYANDYVSVGLNFTLKKQSFRSDEKKLDKVKAELHYGRNACEIDIDGETIECSIEKSYQAGIYTVTASSPYRYLKVDASEIAAAFDIDAELKEDLIESLGNRYFLFTGEKEDAFDCGLVWVFGTNVPEEKRSVKLVDNAKKESYRLIMDQAGCPSN